MHAKTGPLALCREAVLVIRHFGRLLVLFQGCALLTDDNAYEFAPRQIFEAGQVIPFKRKIQTYLTGHGPIQNANVAYEIV